MMVMKMTAPRIKVVKREAAPTAMMRGQQWYTVVFCSQGVSAVDVVVAALLAVVVECISTVFTVFTVVEN